MRELDRFLRSLAGKGEGGLAVIERDGTVLGSSLAADIDVTEADLPGTAGRAVPALVQQLALEAAHQHQVQDGQPYAVASANGERHLVAVAPLSPRTDAALALVHAPAGSTLRAFVANERVLVAAIAAGFILTATALSFLAWRWVARPLAAAQRFAVAQGKAEPLPPLGVW